jgi:hypothetical protein
VVALIKTSILFSYKGTFGHMKRYEYYTYALLGLSWGRGIAVFCTCIFQVSAIKKTWMPEVLRYFIEVIPFLLGNSMPNFITDWMILAVPTVPVLRLYLPTGQRILV